MSGTGSLAGAVAELNKRFGARAVVRMGDAPIEKVEVVSSGSLSLDDALGCGGYPKGRIIEIYGPESSGKTTLALHAIANVQKAGGVAAVVDAEHALDMGYARSLGVDTKELLLSQPDYGEQALDIVDGLVSSGKVGIVLIDSVAALTPKAEIEGDMGAHHVGSHARLMSQALRKLTAIAHNTNTILIFINQIRMKIGVMFGSPETTTGGNALKFYASIRLDVRRKDKIKELGASKSEKDAEVIGNITEVKVVKNKMAPPFRTARFEIHYGTGIDKIGDVLTMALEREVVTKSGAWFSYDGARLGHGYYNAVKALEDDPGMLEQITKATIEAGAK